MGIRERHERERESVRKAILEAARDLFVSEGYQHVSIRKIAERIEYSPAAIYGYFASKDDIFVALAEEGFQLLHETTLEIGATADPEEALRARLWSFYEFSKRHPEHFALMFTDRSVPRIRALHENFAMLTRMRNEFADIVRACIAAGRFDADLDPLAAFRVLGTALSGVAIARLCHRVTPGEDADILARDLINLLIGGLKAGVPITLVAATGECPLQPPPPEARRSSAAH